MRHPSIHRVLALIVATIYANACTNSMLLTGRPGDMMRRGHVDSMTVQRVDGTQLVLLHPEVVRDTLWGTPSDSPSNAKIGIPANDIASASTKVAVFSIGKTLVLVGGIWLGIGVLAALIYHVPF